MGDTPTQRITAPHAQVEGKLATFDQDRHTPLTEDLAQRFATQMNLVFASPAFTSTLSVVERATFADVITHDTTFPFTATMVNGQLMLASALGKSSTPVLKDISCGFTEVCKGLAAETKLGEQAKFMLATVAQAPLMDVYSAAGLSEGPHTGYIHRSC